ncbi:photosynthetic complex assembly protein PuhC [Parerythrobacter aurantius]|uniref:photosynthetic complex assembly protein PuhC n=1 Tax=Parerythrobacter aurantius TaxID=3127706 RepID=UPI0032490F1F
MSHAHHHDPIVPKEALVAAAAMLACVLALTGAVSWGLVAPSANPEMSRSAAGVTPSAQRNLLFADGSDGSVMVTDADTGALVKVIGYGKEGFTRVTLRRLAKQRAREGIGAEAPFLLTRWSNGALSLSDPVTGESAELNGYGADHSAAFAALLEGAGR